MISQCISEIENEVIPGGPKSKRGSYNNDASYSHFILRPCMICSASSAIERRATYTGAPYNFPFYSTENRWNLNNLTQPSETCHARKYNCQFNYAHDAGFRACLALSSHGFLNMAVRPRVQASLRCRPWSLFSLTLGCF